MFKAISNKDGAVTPYEYLPATAGTYSVGEIVKITGGKVAKLGEALVYIPQYICAHEGEVAEGENIAVVRVYCDTVYETEFEGDENESEVKIGKKLRVEPDGLGVSSVAEGAFEVCAVETTNKGDKVRGRFV